MERPKGPLADEAALEQAVRQYQAELLRYAAGILGSWADAEDAVQTAFLKVWQRRARLRPDTMLRPLLYRVTCRNALDQLRRARREARREPAPAQAEPPGWAWRCAPRWMRCPLPTAPLYGGRSWKG